jgi:hypothetical protein
VAAILAPKPDAHAAGAAFDAMMLRVGYSSVPQPSLRVARILPPLIAKSRMTALAPQTVMTMPLLSIPTWTRLLTACRVKSTRLAK